MIASKILLVSIKSYCTIAFCPFTQAKQSAKRGFVFFFKIFYSPIDFEKFLCVCATLETFYMIATSNIVVVVFDDRGR